MIGVQKYNKEITTVTLDKNKENIKEHTYHYISSLVVTWIMDSHFDF